MRKFSCSFRVVDDLIARYENAGGYAVCLDEGVLCSGTWILYSDSYKLRCFYIYEYALNEWSSTQIVQQYKNWNEFPKKYKKMLEVFHVDNDPVKA